MLKTALPPIKIPEFLTKKFLQFYPRQFLANKIVILILESTIYRFFITSKLIYLKKSKHLYY